MRNPKLDDDEIGALLRSGLPEAPEAPFLEAKIKRAIESSPSGSPFFVRLKLVFASMAGVLSVVLLLPMMHLRQPEVKMPVSAHSEFSEEDTSLFEVRGLENETGDVIVGFYDSL
jgi:hypothetical protein